MKNILVINGNDPALTILSSLLTNSGYNVIAEPDGSSALSILDSEEIDVIISDYCLPDMDGPAFIASLKSALPGFPAVIFLSDRVDVEDYLAALGMGAFEFLFRPFHPRELLRIVNVAIRQSPRNKRNALAKREQDDRSSVHKNFQRSLVTG